MAGLQDITLSTLFLLNIAQASRLLPEGAWGSLLQELRGRLGRKGGKGKGASSGAALKAGGSADEPAGLPSTDDEDAGATHHLLERVAHWGVPLLALLLLWVPTQAVIGLLMDETINNSQSRQLRGTPPRCSARCQPNAATTSHMFDRQFRMYPAAPQPCPLPIPHTYPAALLASLQAAGRAGTAPICMTPPAGPPRAGSATTSTTPPAGPRQTPAGSGARRCGCGAHAGVRVYRSRAAACACPGDWCPPPTQCVGIGSASRTRG